MEREPVFYFGAKGEQWLEGQCELGWKVLMGWKKAKDAYTEMENTGTPTTVSQFLRHRGKRQS
jgi:hypothetical protein